MDVQLGEVSDKECFSIVKSFFVAALVGTFVDGAKISLRSRDTSVEGTRSGWRLLRDG